MRQHECYAVSVKFSASGSAYLIQGQEEIILHNIPGLADISVYSESEYFVVYRGISVDSESTVLCKTLKNKYRHSTAAQYLKEEFEIWGAIESNYVVKVFNWFLLDDSSPAFLYEDFEAIPITEIRGIHKLPTAKLLKIAHQIVTALHDIHREKIIFGPLTPQDILFNPETQKIKLTDLGRAQRIHPNLICRGLSCSSYQLPYISPELTGRTNRIIDHRSDFYSLGFCLYQFFTGSLPFTARDPGEYIHYHLAKKPARAQEVENTVPKTVAKILDKLLEKSADRRYQSSRGILHDLDYCRAELDSKGLSLV